MAAGRGKTFAELLLRRFVLRIFYCVMLWILR